MTISRLYETYIADTETSLSARMASLSGGGIAEPYRLQRGAETLAYDLRLERPRRVSLSQLPAALATTLIFQETTHPIWRLEEWDDLLEGVRRREDEYYRFAEYLAYADVVPFETSPIDLKSLVGIATLSPLGVGTAVALVVFGTSPFLLLAVPAGMILCGAAAGVSRGLEEGLRDRILGLLKPRTQQEIELAEALIEARRVNEARMEAEERLKREEQAAQDRARQSDERQAAPGKEVTQQTDVIGAKREETADGEQEEQQRQQYRTSSDS